VIAQITVNGSTIDIPKIFEMTVEHEYIGSRERTAGGKMLMNVVDAKRIWTYRTRAMSKSDADDFIDELRDAKFQEVKFNNDELEEEIDAYVDIEMEERNVDTSATYDKGREIEIIVTEK